MEGRAIARPNPWMRPSHVSLPTSFNGGPDNCPAEPTTQSLVYAQLLLELSLQWRAGQLPGRTIAYVFSEVAVTVDMLLQWRAGQLPGRTLCYIYRE